MAFYVVDKRWSVSVSDAAEIEECYPVTAHPFGTPVGKVLPKAQIELFEIRQRRRVKTE